MQLLKKGSDAKVYLVFECSFAAYASRGQQKRSCFCPCNLTARPRTIFRMPPEALVRHPISLVMIADLAARKTLAHTKPTDTSPVLRRRYTVIRRRIVS